MTAFRPTLASLARDSLAAQALTFGPVGDSSYPAATGRRMLVAFAAVGFGCFYGLRQGLGAAGLRGLPLANLMFVLALLAAFMAVHRTYVRASWADIGLLPWSRWSRRERLYAMQVIPLAVAVFSLVFRDHLMALLSLHGGAGFLLYSVATGMLWGGVQEFVYRGWLQTELVRRFGSSVGIGGANLVFTFGPLHFAQLLGPDGLRWQSVAAVFAIGLFFGLLYRRSGNLWIVALLHGLWPLNMA